MTTAIYVGVDAKGSHRAYRSENGITREWVGPPFAEPRDAIAYAAKLRGVPQVQPSRSELPQPHVDTDGAALSGLSDPTSLGTDTPLSLGLLP